MDTFSRRAFLTSAAVGACLRAQEPTFSTDVKVVNVFAIVHDKLDADGAYRQINVTVHDRNLIVQTREWYYRGR